MSGGIVVGVSGTGSNLRALASAADRGALGAKIVLVFADRECPALDWATEQGIDTTLVPGGDDATLAETLEAVAPDAVVLAGYMRLIGPKVLAAFPGRILNTHPSLLPAFPGAHAVRDALAHGVAVTGCTVHVVDDMLDGGPIVAQAPVPVLAGDDEAALHERIRVAEHQLLPRVVAQIVAGALTVDGRHVRLDPGLADEAIPAPRRALLSVSDKSGLLALATGLVELGFELVSTGGTARTLREGGLPVTDVAAVTGFPEMLDGRIKTLHPRVHGGLLADRRVPDHRRQLVEAGIAPFELVVVNLYPFAKAAARPGIAFDALVEEIDIGGPSMVRAAAKNHANVAIVTDPARYEQVLEALHRGGEIPLGLRSALAAEAFRHTAAYDARIAAELPPRMAAASSAVHAAGPSLGQLRSFEYLDHTADILVQSEGKTGEASITVTASPIANVVVQPSSATLNVGGTLKLTAIATDALGVVLDRKCARVLPPVSIAGRADGGPHVEAVDLRQQACDLDRDAVGEASVRDGPVGVVLEADGDRWAFERATPGPRQESHRHNACENQPGAASVPHAPPPSEQNVWTRLSGHFSL